ncbi:ABC transporter substrate-binding protein [Streptosporangium sp. CA-135522]|uniref:ABC transporter substrate-binding protein n=1 Tax=Streptosporangium sp. CA-135522 TaxID=3240072 RepID=UPI003D8A5B64
MSAKLGTLMAGAMTSALLLSGCATNGGGGGGRTNADTLTLATAVPPNVLDIAHGFNSPSTMVQFAILDTVVTLGEDGSIQPSLAESWTEPKPGTYVFKLRPGVVFSDGSPVTADDVAYSLRRHTDPKIASQAASTVTMVKKVEATGENEVTVELKSPSPTFLPNAALVWQVVPRKLAEAHPDDLGTPEAPTLGTGPYKVASFSVDGVTLERNDKWWRGRAPMAKVKVAAISEPEALRLAIASGSVDGTVDVPPQDARKWEGMKQVKVRYYPGMSIAFLALNVKDKYLSDVHVRRAIAHAVDREAVQRTAVGDKASAASVILPLPQLQALYGEAHEQVTASLPAYPHDLAAAKAEMAQSAYPDGFTIKVSYASDDQRVDALQSVAADLAKIGIRVELKAMPRDAERAKRFRHEDLTLSLTELGYGTPDPGETLPDLLGSTAAKPQGFNFAQYSTPELDARLDRMLGLKGEKRKEAVTEILTEAARQMPYLPLYYVHYGIALNEKFSEKIGPWTIQQIASIKPVGK